MSVFPLNHIDTSKTVYVGSSFPCAKIVLAAALQSIQLSMLIGFQLAISGITLDKQSVSVIRQNYRVLLGGITRT